MPNLSLCQEKHVELQKTMDVFLTPDDAKVDTQRHHLAVQKHPGDGDITDCVGPPWDLSLVLLSAGWRACTCYWAHQGWGSGPARCSIRRTGNFTSLC